ncbi:MAG: FAD binding domain protein [Halorubrum sp. J07HR59]|nr:MAG: FAD binding domain protein [Halorubrum sp. J07HR59]
MTEYSTTDVLVIGSGIAGLSAALGAAREGADVTLATKATQPKGASSWWAQGGIAVSCDGPDQFKQDIQSASGDTADPAAVQALVDDANAAVADILLDTLAVDFDGDRSDSAVKSTQALSGDTPSGFDFGREAAHSESRILHIDASTGKHIHIPYLNYLAGHDAVEIRDDTAALELIRHEGRIHGAILEQDGDFQPCYAGSVVLATGGIGDLYPSRRTQIAPPATGSPWLRSRAPKLPIWSTYSSTPPSVPPTTPRS